MDSIEVQQGGEAQLGLQWTASKCNKKKEKHN